MIYKAVEVIWIFLADGRDGRDGRTGIEGSIRGPRGPKKDTVKAKISTLIKFHCECECECTMPHTITSAQNGLFIQVDIV